MRFSRFPSPQGLRTLPRSFRPVNGATTDAIDERQKAITRILRVEPKAFFAYNQVSDHVVTVAQKLFGYGSRFSIVDYKTSELRQLASFLEEENS